MKSFFLLLALFGTILTVHAEETVTVFEFADSSKSDRGSDWSGDGNWTNAFTKKCKARTNGIGIAPAAATGGQSGMRYTCAPEEPETIAQLAVTCIASFDGAADEANLHTLGITFDNQEPLKENFSFSGKIDTPHTIVFTFSEPITFSTLTITNETDQQGNKNLFEINKIEWRSTYSEITAEFSCASSITITTPLKVQLHSVSGGSGSYTDQYFTFNGETIHVTDSLDVITFDPPTAPGVYTLELTIVDSTGKQAVFTQDITVTLYVPPVNLQATAITRTGFTLSWDQPLSSFIDHYEVKIMPEKNSHTMSISSEWTAVEDGWLLEEPIDLIPITKNLETTLFLTITDWQGQLSYSTDNGETWNPSTNISIQWIIGVLPKDTTHLLLKTTEDAPPEKITFQFTFSEVATKTLDATGDNHCLDITNLPPGLSYRVVVRAVYEKNDGSTLTIDSEEITITLLPIPTFSSVKVNSTFKTVTFTWPAGDELLQGCCRLFATTVIPRPFDANLYISRIYYTSSNESLSTGKAIAITNTSQYDILLDDSYLCTITRPRTAEEIAEGKTEPLSYTWDFSIEDEEGNLTYPYTVPAGGEVIFYSETFKPFQLSDDAISVRKSVLNNLNANYTISLKKNGELCNELKPHENAIVRLQENSLTETEITEIENKSSSLDAFYTPWCERYETSLLKELNLSAYNGQAQIYYTQYVDSIDTLVRLDAHCFLVDGLSTSEETVITIIQKEETEPPPVIKPGFLLRLH